MRHVFTQLRKSNPVNKWPRIPCGKCSTGILKPHMKHPEPIVALASAPAVTYDYIDSEQLHGVGAGLLTCDAENCQESYIIGTLWHSDYDIDPTGEHFLAAFHRAIYIHPPLRLINVAKGTPDEVTKAIADASELVFTNLGAAVNQLRRACEALMSAQGIADKSSTGSWLSLDSRIAKFRKREKKLLAPLDAAVASAPDTDSENAARRAVAAQTYRVSAATELLAVKWLGNDGSHDGSPLELDHVLDAADHVESVLHKLYDVSDAARMQRAAQINAAKGVPPAAPTTP